MQVTNVYKTVTVSRARAFAQNAALCVCAALMIAMGPILQAAGLLRG